MIALSHRRRGCVGDVGETVLYVVRHGQSQWNVEKRFQGQMESPLTEKGLIQAGRAGERLRTEGIDVIVSSDLDRAWQTAKIIGQIVGIDPIPDARFREVDLGAWGGLSREEVASQFPDEWEAWRAGIDVPRGGGESFRDLVRRVGPALADVAARYRGRRVVIVSHGAAIRAMIAYVTGVDFSRIQGALSIPNGSISVVRCGEGGGHFVSIGDTSHLDGVDEPDNAASMT